jgi:DNA modification methylase
MRLKPKTPARNALEMLEQKLGQIRYQAPDALKSYHRVLRPHPEKQIVKLMASIREFGFTMPILVDETGAIIAGEARVEAARRLKMREIPTISIAHLSPAQVRAFRIADNKLASLATFNRDALAIEIDELLVIGEIDVEAMGWETGEVDALFDEVGKDAPGADPADAMPDTPANPTSRPGDLWLLGNHRLLCGSCLDPVSWQRLMAGAVGRMAFTDAPYNVPVQGHVSGLGKARHSEFAMASGEMDEAEFIAFNETYLRLLGDHLVDGAVIAACMDWRHLFELMTAARTVGLSLINLCVWNKTNAGMGSLWRSKHELVLMLKKGRAPHINNVQLGAHGRYRTNVWDYAGVNAFGASRDEDLKDHPTVKPTALVVDAIRDVTRHGDIVLDAFIGSGTTILAAERTGRRAYGIEIEPRFVDVAILRWAAMAGAEPILEETGEPFDTVFTRRREEASEVATAASDNRLNPRPRRRSAA